MTRGLHPHTRPQRAKAGDRWHTPPDGVVLERQEPPPRRVAQALALTYLGLLVSMAGVALFLHLIAPHSAIRAAEAEARFESAAPPLLADPRQPLRAVRARHGPPPGEKRAMEGLVREGWGESEAPPGRAETALDRAESRP